VPQPGEGSSRPRIAPPRAVAPTAEYPTIAFRSAFWVNLHHFLYQQARLGGGSVFDTRDAEETSEAAVAEPERFLPAGAAEAAAWNAAVEFYRSGLARRDLRIAFELVAINRRLAELDGCADLSGRARPECASGLRPEHVAALEAAAPVYRAQRWPDDDHANREWIAAVAPMAERIGRPLGRRLAQVYRTDWPRPPIRVDAVAYAGRQGSYATLEPVHVMIASGDERNQGRAALEVLFHEASHALAGELADGIARRCRALNKPIPRDLWHAVLFYTTGEVVRRLLAASGDDAGEQYLPYGYRHGLYERGWRRYLSLLEEHWQPYLDGRTSFDGALSRLVAAL
jgi:hypothetical protein